MIGEISEGVCSAFGEAAPYLRVCRVGVPELAEGFTNHGGLVGGESTVEFGFSEECGDEREGAC